MLNSTIKTLSYAIELAKSYDFKANPDRFEKQFFPVFISEMLSCEEEFVKPAVQLLHHCIAEKRQPHLAEVAKILTPFSLYPETTKLLIIQRIATMINDLRSERQISQGRKHIVSILLNEYTQLTIRRACVCQIGLSADAIERIQEKTVQDILLRLPLLVPHGAINNNLPHFEQSLRASIYGITNAQRYTVVNAILTLNIVQQGYQNNYHISPSKPGLILESMRDQARTQLEEIYADDDPIYTSHNIAWDKIFSQTSKALRRCVLKKFPGKIMMTILSIIFMSMLLGQISPFFTIIATLLITSVCAYYARYTGMNIYSLGLENVSQPEKFTKDITFLTVVKINNVRQLEVAPTLPTTNAFSFDEETTYASDPSPTTTPYRKEKPIILDTKGNTPPTPTLLEPASPKKSLSFKQQRLDESKLVTVVNGVNQRFYLDKESILASFNKKQRNLWLDLWAQFKKISVKFAPSTANDGLVKLKPSIPGKVKINEEILSVSFTHELKGKNLGKKRILFCELQLDDLSTLYVGCKYLPNGLHSSKDISSTDKSLETPIQITLPYKQVAPTNSNLDAHRKREMRR